MFKIAKGDFKYFGRSAEKENGLYSRTLIHGEDWASFNLAQDKLFTLKDLNK